MPTAVRSHAKINLGLYVGGPRPDGFHGLTTVYQTLELHDVVTVTARPAAKTVLRLTSNDRRVPTDDRNTAWKMVELALHAWGMTAEVEIHIDKRLPVQGGMGAGSANAVAALVGLEVELGIGDGRNATDGPSTALEKSQNAGPSTALRSAQDDKTEEKAPANLSCFPPSAQSTREGRGAGENWQAKRLQIAAEVGSDVPLFLIGGTSLGLDRGQDVYPLPDIDRVWCVVALPEVGVSTAQAFRDWDALCATEGLTQDASTDKLKQLSRAYAGAFAGGVEIGPAREGEQGADSYGALVSGEGLAGPQESALVRTGISSWIENDFERVVFPQQPSLREIKRLLAASGTPEASLTAMLSGSGSALFGLYQAREAADAACQRLQTAGVRSQLTRTLPRSAYWQQMLS
jgi:4-diphosphocytidyl-2-C-methyl-D-erythritol kinase